LGAASGRSFNACWINIARLLALPISNAGFAANHPTVVCLARRTNKHRAYTVRDEREIDVRNFDGDSGVHDDCCSFKLSVRRTALLGESRSLSGYAR
jgi:hypothetical protein